MGIKTKKITKPITVNQVINSVQILCGQCENVVELLYSRTQKGFYGVCPHCQLNNWVSVDAEPIKSPTNIPKHCGNCGKTWVYSHNCFTKAEVSSK